MIKKTIHIKLNDLSIDHDQQIKIAYFSFRHEQQQYFSSAFNHMSSGINNDIIIQILEIPQNLYLSRWQNHMIMFTHEVNISELKTRKCLKKKIETSNQQTLIFTVTLLDQGGIVFGNSYIQAIGQHYLIIQSIQLKGSRDKKRISTDATYFVVIGQNISYYLPVNNSKILIHLPERFRIKYHNNNEYLISQIVETSALTNNKIIVELYKNGSHNGTAQVVMKWGINLHTQKIENSLLLEAHEIILYEFEVKFDNYSQLTNTKVKIIYGSKAFQLVSDFNSSKITKIRKIVNFMVKTNDEEIAIIIQRNNKSIGHCTFNSGEIGEYQIGNPKKKLVDLNGKIFGFIKFKVEMAKTLTTPKINQLWRQTTKKKLSAVNSIISVAWLSVKYPQNDDIIIIIKTQQKQVRFANLVNLNYFDPQNSAQQHKRTLFHIKPQQNIYFMLRKNQVNEVNQSNFLGIAVVSIDKIRLGINPITLQFFKNQQETCKGYMLINKIIPYPFIKPIYQFDTTPPSLKLITVSLFINRIQLTPYFYTYEYDQKKQLYCIIQINKNKKVLILAETQAKNLTFTSTSGSDSLIFTVEETQYIRMKVTFLISNVGHEQQIYANGNFKVKTQQLLEHQTVELTNIDIMNQVGTDVGKINLEVHKTNEEINRNPGPFRSDLRKVKNQITRVNESMQAIENSVTKESKKSSRNYSGSKNNRYRENTNTSKVIRLPTIKQKKQKINNLDEILENLKIRKRGMGGMYSDPPVLKKSFQNQQQNSKKLQPYRRIERSFDYGEFQKNNPNLDKNFDILFPSKKLNDKSKKKTQKDEIEEKLKGLRSVYHQISDDIGQIEPTIKQSRQQQNNGNTQTFSRQEFNAPQWQGNQFVDDKPVDH